MDKDRWEQLKENIRGKFNVSEEGIEDLMALTSDGEVKAGTAEFLIVATPLGKIKLTLESRPVVLDKKFIYSHRAGAAARTEYKFSESESSHKLRAFKWDPDEDEWQEIDAANFEG